MKAIVKTKTYWAVILMLSVATGVGCWQRESILAWYYVRQLHFAYQDNRDGWIKRVLEHEEAALPHVLLGLHGPDAIVCANMQAALGSLVKKWGPTSEQSHQLIFQLCEEFEQFSPAGQEKTLLFMTTFLQQDGNKPLPPSLAKSMGELLLIAERENGLRGASLLLAAELVDCVQPGQWVDACRDMADRGLSDQRHGIRIAALQLLLREPMRKDKELVSKAIPLLRDKEPAVRRVGLLVLAPERELVSEEALMPLLHDEDAEVQTRCEMVLRQRGLSDSDITLARWISDKNPTTRMRVLHLLPQLPDLNLAEWLQRLSQDPSPAVRAAAVRAAGENPSIDMSERLREMAQRDPSDTVRMNAQFYVRHRLAQRAMNER